jgi:hypothetical protein
VLTGGRGADGMLWPCRGDAVESQSR